MGLIEGGEDECWEESDEEEFIVKKTVSKSQTSITDGIGEKGEKSEIHTLPTIRSPSSFSLLSELDLNRRVDPLPENIEEIYLKAASVKKGYQKVQKKKGGRKENREED